MFNFVMGVITGSPSAQSPIERLWLILLINWDCSRGTYLLYRRRLSRYLMINLSIGTVKGDCYQIDKNEGRCPMTLFLPFTKGAHYGS